MTSDLYAFTIEANPDRKGGHGAVYINSTAVTEFPEPIDADLLAARQYAASVLARVTVLALPHVTATAYRHRCLSFTGNPLDDDHPLEFWPGCGVETFINTEEPLYGQTDSLQFIEITCPAKVLPQWTDAARRWLSMVADSDAAVMSGYIPLAPRRRIG